MAKKDYVMVISADSELAVFGQAIAEFNKFTCIRWIPQTAETEYVDIRNDASGCWSYIGKVPSSMQPQTLHLGQNCLTYVSIMTCIWSCFICGLTNASGRFHEPPTRSRIHTQEIKPFLYIICEYMYKGCNLFP